MKQIINYFLLILVILVSFLSIRDFEMYPQWPYEKSLDGYRLFAPGFLFSIYLIFLERRNRGFGRLLVFFCILLILYYISLMAGFTTWGMAVPVVGGIGALLIKKLFYLKSAWLDPYGRQNLVWGFVAGLIGWILFFITRDNWTMGFRFGLILLSWQLTIGLLWIKQINQREISNC
jgi:hypothetical protein